MRLVCISDTHEQHRALEIPPCDILVHSGDITYRGAFSKVYDLAQWFSELQAADMVKHVVCIAGNHDLTAASDPRRFASYFQRENMHYLHCSGVEIEGVRFYGDPFTPAFGSGWAFQLPRTSIQAKQHWNGVPKDIDILVTHGPAYGIGDKVPDYDLPSVNVNTGRVYYQTYKRDGCPALREMLESRDYKYHICGHFHDAYGVYQLDNGVTTSVNASSCTEAYKPLNEPIVIDL